MMLSMAKLKGNRGGIFVAGAVTVTLMAMTAVASQGLVQDRRVTPADAERLAARARGDAGEFPITLNDAVVRQLNRYVGTPEGREFMRGALARMENHRKMVEGHIAAYDVPRELLAVPITESGYENMVSKHTQRAAGIWMFIASTARNFGLRVDDKVDERLNLELETDAAMRYLKGERLRFKDWELALLSYNAGDRRVQEGIAKTGSRDAWVLIRSGFEGDRDYLAKLMAAVLIMKNPEVLD